MTRVKAEDAYSAGTPDPTVLFLSGVLYLTTLILHSLFLLCSLVISSSLGAG